MKEFKEYKIGDWLCYSGHPCIKVSNKEAVEVKFFGTNFPKDLYKVEPRAECDVWWKGLCWDKSYPTWVLKKAQDEGAVLVKRENNLMVEKIPDYPGLIVQGNTIKVEVNGYKLHVNAKDVNDLLAKDDMRHLMETLTDKEKEIVLPIIVKVCI